MPPTSHYRGNVHLTAAVGIIIILVSASYLSYQYGYARGEQAAVPPQTQAPAVRTVVGTVESIADGRIVLKNFQKIPSAVSALNQTDRLTISVGPATVIERLTPRAATAERTATSTNPYTVEKIALADVKAGDLIAAFADEDIANLTAFTATKIDLQHLPTPAVR